MKKHIKLILAVVIAALLAAVYFADFEKNEPLPKNGNVVQKDEKSSDLKIKETYKPAHGDSRVASDTPPKEEKEDIPENGNPQPKQTADAPQKTSEPLKTEKTENTCTLTVRCDAAVGKINSDKEGIVPSDGLIFPETKAEIKDGDSVFDILLREMQSHKIHMEFSKTPAYDNVYIEGIGNLYEFDCGELSGWMYRVNGEFPKYGCSDFKVSPGDKIEFLYTCNLGRDIGGSNAAD